MAKRRMGTHSQTTCGSEPPAICSCTGGQSWKAVLATPCLAGKAEEDLSWGSSITFYFYTPEAFNKNTLGCRKEGDQTLGPASSRSEPRAGASVFLVSSQSRPPPPPGSPARPLIFSDIRPSKVESQSPLQLSCAREERNRNPDHKETSPPSQPIPREPEPLLGSALFLAAGSGVSVGVCARASAHAPKLNFQPRPHPSQCRQQRDSRAAGPARREGCASPPAQWRL